MTTNKRKTLCLHQKVALIRAIEQGEKKSHVGRLFGLGPSSVSTIWKSKEKILQAEAEGSSSKKIRKPKFEDLDKAMLKWFQKQCINNVPITGPILKSKAEEFAEQLGITSFKASEGWLGKFKQRHNINYGQMSGEARDVKRIVIKGWLEKVWPLLTERYSPDDIFIGDEASIFYKMIPDKAQRLKLSKERIGALVAANMSGTEKRKLVVIGKSKNVTCVEAMKRLPVIYRTNQSAGMTSQIFEEEIRRWDAELAERKILVLVDSCPAHFAVPNLWNIELAFFPSNAFSVVVKSLKSLYRKKMLMEIIESDGKFSISVLDAVNFLSKAWDEVTSQAIQRSFRKAGLCRREAGPEFELDEGELPLSEWITQFDMPDIFTSEELRNFESIDEELATTAQLTDEEILEAVTKGDSEQQDDEQEELLEDPSVERALDAAKVLEKFLLFHEDDPGTFEDMSKIYSKIQSKFWDSKRIRIKQEIVFCE